MGTVRARMSTQCTPGSDPSTMTHSRPLGARRFPGLRAARLFRRTAALAVGLTLLGACREAPPVTPPPEVTVAQAVDRNVADWDEFTGYFEAVQSVEVRPRVSGFVQRVAFVEGAMVKQGDPLFVIDP